MDPATDDLLGPSERQDDDGQRASGDDARLTDPGDAKHAAPCVDVIAARAVGSATHSSPAPVRSVALQVPSRDELEAIARRQDAKHAAMQAAKSQGQRDEEEAAAALIQRNYRGYKQRRELAGMGLDPSTRWVESTNEDQLSPEERERRRARKAEAKREREKTAKVMDLQYWLEMVDQKHRYGSNLRAYHTEWKKSGTHENFFYWLDYGEGKNLEVPTCSRERLEKEQVRYLSREERQNYIVKIDKEGRLCWAKNGERITTSTEYKDSVNGIVPNDDGTPAYSRASSSSSSSSSASSILSTGSANDPEGEHYVNHDLENAKGVKKIKHVSAAAVLNHLLRRSVKPNSWIFVADTSFRLYVGIKQSGAFQHSSFLHGARISAAGLIKIKDGQLRRLSPLSGHYRPPTSNFRAFVHSLRDAGVDMSRVSISRSYAILVGLEAYVKTRQKFKSGAEHASHGKEKILHPEEAAKREEQQKDKSKSAERERQILAHAAEKEEEEKRSTSLRLRVLRKLGFGGAGAAPKSEKKKKSRGEASSRDAESGIPPEGRR
ncbi:hypothetical protein GTA08_BOTSDO02616 [Botryosphaeria dothidea]|uniref:Iq calmodulin-binding motif protein n=1 Tax=Botryosphaeria dothidea TaxID=55169 RepID=A0A8H4N3K2_9PEZI|nr:hypothetical protein GTA08_BOTSDO02616 [Botryosphaeria dothidea]